jgi:ribosomal-protein-alanine N-acetyltransferase
MRGADKRGSRFRINISYFYCRKYLFNRASQVRLNKSQASTTAGRVREASRATSLVKEIRLHIETHRLRLRPVMAEDVADLYRIYGDPATNTFNPAGPYPDIDYASTVLQRWLAHWHDRGFGNWAISARDAPKKIIGFGGLTIRRYNDVILNNLGYRFATEAWGKGLATDLATSAVRYGFEAIKLTEISAVVRANHLASRKVLEKAGLRFINEIADIENAPPSLLYSLTLSEWLSQSG